MSIARSEAQIIGKYDATAVVVGGDLLMTSKDKKIGTIVRLEKDNESVLRGKTELYETHVAALEKLKPVFGDLLSD